MSCEGEWLGIAALNKVRGGIEGEEDTADAKGEVVQGLGPTSEPDPSPGEDRGGVA